MKTELNHATPFRLVPGWTALVTALSTVLVAADLGLRRLLGRLVDDPFAHDSAQALQTGLVLAALLLAAHFLLPYCRNQCLHLFQGQICRRLLDKTLQGQQRALNKVSAAELATLYEADVQVVLRYIERMLGRFLPDVLLWLLAAALLFSIHPLIGAVGVLSAVCPAVFMTLTSKKIGEKNGAYQQAIQACNGVLSRAVESIETVKTSRMEAVLEADYARQLQKVTAKRREMAFWEAVVSAPTLVTAFLTMFAIALAGGWLACRGLVGAGSLLVCVTLTDAMVSPVMSLDGTLSAIRRCQAALGRLNAFLTLPQEEDAPAEGATTPATGKAPANVTKTPAAPKAPVGAPGAFPVIDSIVCRDLRFGYQPDKPVLTGLSCRCQKGQLTLLVGKNGAGKSTLGKLLAKVYPPDGGDILLGGVPVAAWPTDSLRRRVAVFAQEPLLFSGSIRQNLLGENATQAADRMIACCRLVGIHEEICRLPEGYDSQLYENGKPLSRGQRQRLCMARTLLRQAEVYLFDEPTAALDAAHAQQVIDAIRRLAAQAVVILITHDAGVRTAADQVIQLQRNSEEGTI